MMMKSIYKSLFLSVALLLGMTSCDSKDEFPPTGPLDNAENIIAGTYVGEWTYEYVENSEVKVGSGTITFSVDPQYSNNVSVIEIYADDIDFHEEVSKKSVCNVSLNSSGDLWYWNQYNGNPLGTTFYGKVDSEKNITMDFTRQIVVKEGRKEVVYTYIYSFTGHKQ